MESFYSSHFRLGILGGGQLGRMFIQEAINYDVRTKVMDPSPEAPCASIASEFVQGDFNNESAVLAFGKGLDVLTIEIEHVHVGALQSLENDGVKVYPQPNILRMIQDKGLQKAFYQQHNIPTAPFRLIESVQEITSFPIVQKMRKGGYDGKGVQVLRSAEDLSRAFHTPSVLEELVDFEKEIAVIVARNARGEVSTFPLVEMEFNPEANLVEFLFSPANVSEQVAGEASSIAVHIAQALQLVGILAVEMFVTRDGKVLVNEMAPRPHNSGHHTIEACTTSQYEQHLRAILNMPLGDTQLIQPAVMINLLGAKDHSGPVKYEGLENALQTPGVHVHLYGKAETKPFRKMGHFTVVNPNLETAKSIARNIQIRVISQN